MLNGKFYTGLPPKMIERSGANVNRLESHIFWPDDTKTDSAVETRVKRRASLQLPASEKPRIQKQMSFGDDDVDTKKMFRREFTKSSIQFFDNIPEEKSEFQQRPRPTLRVGKFMKQEITPKPTATKLELPEETVNASYTSAQKKQAFTSKIQFNDYVDEDLNNRYASKLRTNKMDMNDKKEVERNSKNSPKLQVKRNVGYLRMEEPKNNDYDVRERFAPERSFLKQAGFEAERKIRSKYQPDSDYHDDRMQQPIKTSRTALRKRNDLYNEMEIPQRYEARHGNNYVRGSLEDLVEVEVEDREQMPKKILKNRKSEERFYRNKDYRNDYDDMHFIENNMRNLRANSAPPKKHVTYCDEIFEQEKESPRRKYYVDNNDDGDGEYAAQSSTSLKAHNSRIKMINTRAGSPQRQHAKFVNNDAYLDYDMNMDMNGNVDVDVDVDNANIEHYQYMETCSQSSSNNNKNHSNNKSNNNRSNSARKSLNNIFKYNNSTNNNNNKHNNHTSKAPVCVTPTLSRRKISPKITMAAAARATTSNEASESNTSSGDAKKHLRSSLCFNNGEIVAKNDTATSSASSTKTPTSHLRRNARSSATQRVSVGLPD